MSQYTDHSSYCRAKNTYKGVGLPNHLCMRCIYIYLEKQPDQPLTRGELHHMLPTIIDEAMERAVGEIVQRLVHQCEE